VCQEIASQTQAELQSHLRLGAESIVAKGGPEAVQSGKALPLFDLDRIVQSRNGCSSATQQHEENETEVDYKSCLK
jgi:hypothetical protein